MSSKIGINYRDYLTSYSTDYHDASIPVPAAYSGVYIIFQAFCIGATTTAPVMYWDGDDVSGLTGGVVHSTGTLWGGSREGVMGYFPVPSGDYGTTKTLRFDWGGTAQSTVELQYHVLFNVGDITEAETFTETSGGTTPYTVSETLVDGEMLWGMCFTGADGNLACTAGREVLFNQWNAVPFSMSAAYEIGIGSTSITFDTGDPHNFATLFLKLEPVANADTIPWINSMPDYRRGGLTSPWWYEPWAGLGTSMSFTLRDDVNLLVVTFSSGLSNTLPTAFSYNGDALTLFQEYDSGSESVAVWYLVNPDTGGAYTLTRTGGGTSGDERWCAFSVVNGDTANPFGDYDIDETNLQNNAANTTSATTEDYDFVMSVTGNKLPSETATRYASSDHWHVYQSTRNAGGAVIWNTPDSGGTTTTTVKHSQNLSNPACQLAVVLNGQAGQLVSFLPRIITHN